MALNKLTDRKVENFKGPGKLNDGGGLWLSAQASGAKQWFLRFVMHGRRREMGIGPYPTVTLAKARSQALEARRLVYDGIDPIDARKRSQAVPTFESAAREVHRINLPTWRNKKHGAQFLATLETYAFPKLGDKLVTEIISGDVLAVLQPIWLSKPETARRVKQRLGTVLKWVQAQGLRVDNPTDAASAGLPKQTIKPKNMKALPYSEISECISTIQASNAYPSTKLSLEFLILTASRSGEVRGAAWNEVDWETGIWTIPEDRMKAANEHRVPLSDRSLKILTEAQSLSDGSDLIFPGAKFGKPLSDATIRKLIRENGYAVDVHGFRASFKTWATEATNTPREIVEACLAHQIGNAAERAYERSDRLEKRRVLLQRWSDYVAHKHGEVVRIA